MPKTLPKTRHRITVLRAGAARPGLHGDYEDLDAARLAAAQCKAEQPEATVTLTEGVEHDELQDAFGGHWAATDGGLHEEVDA